MAEAAAAAEGILRRREFRRIYCSVEVDFGGYRLDSWMHKDVGENLVVDVLESSICDSPVPPSAPPQPVPDQHFFSS